MCSNGPLTPSILYVSCTSYAKVDGQCIRKSPLVWHGLGCLARLARLAGLAVRNLHPLIFSQNFYIATTMS